MQSDESGTHHPELEFFRECMTALSNQDYRVALEALKQGLDDASQVAEQLNSKWLILMFLAIVIELESNLQKAYGDQWEERIEIPPIPKEQQILRCSFCGKAWSEVVKLIAGASAYICNECIGICNEILDESLTAEFPHGGS